VPAIDAGRQGRAGEEHPDTLASALDLAEITYARGSDFHPLFHCPELYRRTGEPPLFS